MTSDNNGTHNGYTPGSIAGFDALLRKHERAVMRLAWGVLRNRHAAEDVAQEALMRLWQEHQKQAVPEQCDSWLREVVLNLSRDRLRRDEVFKERGSVEGCELISSNGTVESASEANEDATRLKAQIAALSTQQRLSILLVFGEGLSHDEAALVMNCSKSTLRNHLKAAKRSLDMKNFQKK